MAKGTEKALSRLMSDAPITGAVPSDREKKEVTSVTIEKAHNGFTVRCQGPGMYDMKPAVAKDWNEAASLAGEYIGESGDEGGDDTEED